MEITEAEKEEKQDGDTGDKGVVFIDDNSDSNSRSLNILPSVLQLWSKHKQNKNGWQKLQMDRCKSNFEWKQT